MIENQEFSGNICLMCQNTLIWKWSSWNLSSCKVRTKFEKKYFVDLEDDAVSLDFKKVNVLAWTAITQNHKLGGLK